MLKSIRTNTHNGFEIKITDDNNVPRDLTGHSFRIDFKANITGIKVFSYSTADNTITFKENNPLLGIILLQKRELNYPVGCYKFDIKMTTTNGDIITIAPVGGFFKLDLIQNITE